MNVENEIHVGSYISTILCWYVLGRREAMFDGLCARSKYQRRRKPRPPLRLACHTTLCNVSAAGVPVNRLNEPKSYLPGCLCRVALKCAELFQKSDHQRMPHVLCA